MANTTTGDDKGINFDVEFTDPNPVRKIKKRFRPYLDIPPALFGKKVLQKYLVQRVRNRFKREGEHPVAQKAPSGKAWPKISRLYYCKKVETLLVSCLKLGALSRSIVIIKDTLNNALYTNTGGGFRIGVKATGRNYLGRSPGEYARIQNYGSKSEGWSGRNYKTWIPARRYLGIGQPDKDAVNLWIKRTMKRA